MVLWHPPKREQTTLNLTSAVSATTACIGVNKPRAHIAVNVLGMGLMMYCVMGVSGRVYFYKWSGGPSVLAEKYFLFWTALVRNFEL